jgi:hypothetical protein
VTQSRTQSVKEVLSALLHLMRRPLWGYNPVSDDRSNFTQSRPLQGYMSPRAQLTPFLLSEALRAHDVHVCLEPQSHGQSRVGKGEPAPLKLRVVPFGTVYDLRTTTSQKCAGGPRI